MRVAIFFTPPANHPLTVAAANWLGRDAFSGEEIDQPAEGGFSAGEIRGLTAAARRYGFHATLKAPFHIAPHHDLTGIAAALDSFCSCHNPIRISSLRIERLGSFFALTPAASVPGLNALADAAVERFDRYRAPATAEEIARRHPERLTAGQRENLERWGYPFVFGDFRFHMTLTGEVPEAQRQPVARILEARFAALAAEPLIVNAVSLFVETQPPSDFVVSRTAPMTRTAEPMDAA